MGIFHFISEAFRDKRPLFMSHTLQSGFTPWSLWSIAHTISRTRVIIIIMISVNLAHILRIKICVIHYLRCVCDFTT